MNEETYLGDGLYASFDGYMLGLRAPRADGDHWVYMEPLLLEEFLRFACRFKLTEIVVRGTVKQLEQGEAI